jgi:CheY-like chemotaxis protein
VRNSVSPPAVSVLFVDDNEDMRLILNDLLRAEGFEVTTAIHGEDALEKLSHMPRRPDVILLDIMMPVMSGIDFIEEAGRNRALSEIPIVVLTAAPEIPLPPVAMQLAKGAPTETLLASLRGAARR